MADGAILTPSHRDYQPAVDTWPERGHGGLVFDRYLPLWQDRGGGLQPERLGLQDPLFQFVRAYQRGAEANAARLERWHQRLDRINAPGLKETFVTTWRLTTGLGADHPIENGFGFDYSIGVPVMRGSAVKGLYRRGAELLGLEPQAIYQLFGSDAPPGRRKAGRRQAGAVVFHDAYPAQWPRLEVDVANVHHRRYYGGQLDHPAETESPVPVLFLTVAPETEFIFRLSPRAAGEPGLDQARECLDFGLELLGIGAKTAVGYGQMLRHSAGKAWVAQQVTALAQEHRTPETDILGGRLLARAWQALDDPQLQADALQEIRGQWQERGWWDEETPPSGKSRKAAWKIYQGME